MILKRLLTAFSICTMLSASTLEINLLPACAENPNSSTISDAKLTNAGLSQPQDAKLDSNATPFKLSAEQSLNLELLTPKSDWNKVYSIGRAAYIDGDYRRAFNAFKLALIKAKAQGIKDGRLTQTEAAMKQAQPNATSLDARLGFKVDSKQKLQARIEKVFPGSLAWLAGIKADDRIISMKETGNVTKLSVSRNGKVIFATITDKYKLVTPDFNRLNATTDQSLMEASLSQQITDIGLLSKNQNLLANHDLVLIIDKSGSMGSRFSRDESQLEWCQSQLADLNSVSGYFPSGITAIFFDSGFETYKNQSIASICSILKNQRPGGGTDLAEPFNLALSDYFSHRTHVSRPLIIAVISDFCTAGEQVREGVLEASKKLRNKEELTISLLEVGRGGRRLVAALDSDMVEVGAPFDIVDATTSDTLLQIGLKNALIAALYKKRMQSTTVKPAQKKTPAAATR